LTTLSLYEDVLAAGEVRALSACARVLYVASGEASGIAAGEAWFGSDELEVRGGHEGATVLRWELTDWEPEGAKLAARVELDPWAEYVVRCDRVDFPSGAVAYRHDHPGPGIRCVLSGTLRIEGRDGAERTYGPFDAWFEGAEAPVVASASDAADTAFVRVLLLPAEWRGKRTIRYLDPADEERPKLQRATVLLEEDVSL
jgi:quercetin dioxygenase-like cupin family protein